MNLIFRKAVVQKQQKRDKFQQEKYIVGFIHGIVEFAIANFLL